MFASLVRGFVASERFEEVAEDESDIVNLKVSLECRDFFSAAR